MRRLQIQQRYGWVVSQFGLALRVRGTGLWHTVGMAKRPRDSNQLAKLIVDIAVGEAEDDISGGKGVPNPNVDNLKSACEHTQIEVACYCDPYLTNISPGQIRVTDFMLRL